MSNKLRWTPGTKKDLRELEEDVRADFGYALYPVEDGKNAAEIDQAIAGLEVKQMSAYGGLVFEFKKNFDNDTYRCVYTARFQSVVYVLHVFKKKSKSGIGLPKEDDNLIREHLKWAEDHFREHPVKEDEHDDQG